MLKGMTVGSENTIEIVGCHAEGEVGDVIIGGVEPPPGETIWEQAQWIAHDQTLREDISHISFCQFTKPVFEETGQRTGKNNVVLRPGKVDRCPTGTGLSARLAVMHARGQARLGDTLLARSIIDSEFLGCI